jgi:hypothetical protein
VSLKIQQTMTSIAVPSTQQQQHASRTYASNIVFCNVYDIAFHNDYLLPIFGIGIFHSSIEVFGAEFGFGRSANGPGCFVIEPQSYPNHVYRESFALGATNLAESDVFWLHNKMIELWQGSSYHLLKRNCNHYSHEFGKILLSAKDANEMREWVEEYTENIFQLEREYQKKQPEEKRSRNYDEISNTQAMMSAANKSRALKKCHVLYSSNWKSMVPVSKTNDSIPICEVTYGGQLSLWKVLKGAFCGGNSSSSFFTVCYDEIFPQWLNRVVRVGMRLLKKEHVRKIENGDRWAAGMNELTEEDDGD